jgi:hypothetical protein
MRTQLPITIDSNRDGQQATRSYVLTFLADSPSREEAVGFFTANARLVRDACIPRDVEAMPLDVAQAYLDAHPMRQQWRTLIISHRSWVFDRDLARLEHLPEIKSVQITSSRITDSGIQNLKYLANLEQLIICSRKVTNACLSHLLQHRNLQMLDLQMAPRVSHKALFRAAANLPQIKETFPPRRWPIIAIVRWFYVEWQIQRKQRRQFDSDPRRAN